MMPLFRAICVLVVLGWITPAEVAAQPPDTTSVLPQNRTVDVPRVDDAVTIDGLLEEAVWTQAAVLKRFFQYLPSDGKKAADSTEVLVWYAPTAMYFGIRAYAPRAQVRATLAERDKIEGDDYIEIVLDTYDDRRQAFIFGVNPLGVQSDGILRDAQQESASFGGRARGKYSIDRSPDFVYESQGHLTEFGYVVEIRIPFKSLRYQRSDVQSWGLNIIRRVQYTGYEDTWNPVLQSGASFLAQSGRIEGLSGLVRGLVLDVTPEMTSAMAGSRDLSGWGYDPPDYEVGGNVRWGVTNNVTANATFNPDFSQIEADAAQIQYDPRQTLFFDEKRPFFLDGIELFETPNQLIYTRRVVDPYAAVKVSGKLSSTSVGVLSALDAGDRVFHAVRVRHDLAEQSFVGGALTDVEEDGRYNRVVAADAQVVFRKRYTVAGQVAFSASDWQGSATTAPLWMLRGSRSGRYFGFDSMIEGIHPDFDTQAGFISRGATVRANVRPRVSRYGREGSLLESIDGSVLLDALWDYDRFFGGVPTPDEIRLHFTAAMKLRGGWYVAPSFLVESWLYPPSLYTDLVVQRRENGMPVDTVAFEGTHRIYPLDLVVSVQTPRYQTFNGSVFVIGGRDVNFYEWAPSNIFFVIADLQWRPTDQLRLGLQYNHQQYIRPSDWSVTSVRTVPRLKLEYQLTKAFFVRFIGQYDAFMVDALRDDERSFDPVLRLDPGSGRYVPTLAQRRNDFRVDWLLSYRPTPGTVFFLGYGSSLEEPDAYRFRHLRRTADGFFVKLSYLIRAR